MFRCSAATLGIVLLLPLSATTFAADFEAGAATRIITPDPLLPVSGGLGPTAPATGKRGELTARAVVFRAPDTVVAVVSLDLLGFPSVLADRVRSQVKQIPAENILIGATHTHSAPDCYAFPDGSGGHTGDLAYMDRVCKETAIAIQQAFDALQPCHLKAATGEAQGKIAYNYYAPDLYDRRMSVLQAVTPQGKSVCTLVNYAVHPEVLGAREGLLSPDLVGPLCDRLEDRFGGVAMFMNGAQGGMITADNRDLERPKDALRGVWNDRRVWEECVRIGHLMADEATRFIEDAPLQKSPQLRCTTRNVKFPVDNETLWNVIIGSPLKYPRNPDRTVTSRLNLVQLGNCQILTIPGEALPNIGFYLKRKMQGEHQLLFGLTNDAFGYIMTQVDFASFPRYDYISRTSLGEQTGEILIENALAMIHAGEAPGKLEARPLQTDEAAPPAAKPATKRPRIVIDGRFEDWSDLPSYTDPPGDTHDTEHKKRDDKPIAVNHPDADLLEYRVTHDAENLYCFFRSRGKIANTRKSQPNDPPGLEAGRYYMVLAIDVDNDDRTGYWIHEGGYFPTSRGYDVNAEVEYYDGELNTVCYLNHGAMDAAELRQAFLDQSSNQYREGHDGPYPAGFMRLLPGTYKQYTQWVPHADGRLTFVRDKGPVVHGIGSSAVGADGHRLECCFPFAGFLKDENGKPIVQLGNTLNLSFSLEASGELGPDRAWASDTAEPLRGYVLTP